MIQQRFNGPFFQDNPGELAPELSETLTKYTTLVVFRFLTNTPRPSSLPLDSNTNQRDKAERTMKNRGQERTLHLYFLLNSRFDETLGQSLVLYKYKYGTNTRTIRLTVR